MNLQTPFLMPAGSALAGRLEIFTNRNCPHDILPLQILLLFLLLTNIKMQKKLGSKEHASALNRIWKKVIFESVGPFHPGDHENHFVLCLSDPISGWVELLAAKELSTQGVADFLVDIYLRLGVCTCELTGWAQAHVKAIARNVADKWKSLLRDPTDLDWDQFWEDTIQIVHADWSRTDIAKKIHDMLSGLSEDMWEHKLNTLRLSLRLQSASFSLMFGREFVPSCPKRGLESNTVCKVSRGRPRLTNKSKLQSKMTKSIEQVAMSLVENVMEKRYCLRTILKPKGNAKEVHTLLLKATENRQLKQLENKANLQNVPIDKMETNENGQNQLLPSPCNELSAAPLRKNDPDYVDSAMSDDASDSCSSEIKKRKRVPRKLRKLRDSLPFKCPKCIGTYVSSEKELSLHLDCHKEGSRLFHCSFCTKQAKSWAHMQRHLMYHPQVSSWLPFNALDKRTCPECQKQFHSRDGMLRHLSVLHRGQAKFTCKTCGANFKERKTYERHVDLHVNLIHKCKHCAYETKIRKNIVTHERIHDGRGFQCEICSKIFTKPSILKTHMEIHEKERPTFTCDLCGMQLLGKASLNQHIKNMHMERESVPCSLCSYVAKGPHNLPRHMARAHNHPFKCTKCDYSTQSENALQKHMNVFHDEEERPHPCTACPYRAKDTKSLRDHVRLSHNPNITQFLCPHCGKAFKTLTMMRHHLPSHTGQHLYSCKICAYTAKYRQTIHHHIRSKHPGENASDIVKGTTAEEIVMLQGTEHNYFQTHKDNETDLAISSLQDGVVIASNENEIILNADLLASQPSGSFTLPNNIEVQIIEQMAEMDEDQKDISFHIMHSDVNEVVI